MKTPASERPDKKEGVFITVKEGSGKETTKTFEIVDEGGTRTLRDYDFLKGTRSENPLLEDLFKAVAWNVN